MASNESSEELLRHGTKRRLARLPLPVRVAFGVACIAVGVMLTLRPFTSLSMLLLLVAVASVITGLTRWSFARRTIGRVDDAIAIGWLLLGAAVLAWPDLSLRSVALLVGVGMIVAGAGDLVGLTRGPVDARLVATLSGFASVVFGVLALSWPDVTVLVVAIVFGARTIIFGVSVLTGSTLRSRGDVSVEPPSNARRVRRVILSALSLVVALALAAVSIAIHRAEPVVGAFYDAPAEVPDSPGALLRIEPFTRGVPDGATAWRILYTTTRDEGEPALASAIVIAPDEASTTPRPVIAWAHGTTGIARNCAPSVLSDPLGSGAFYVADRVITEGWVVVATDYTGLGAQGDHPYMVGQAEGRSVLDAVRAAKQIGDLHLDDRTVVWGHSQGGGAALWTGELAPTYAPDVNVLGVAALAPASDIPAFVDTLYQVTGGSIFASYVLTGYATTYPDVRVADYVRPSARTVVEKLADRCLGEPAFLVSILTSVTTSMDVFSAPLGDGPLGEHLAENVPVGPLNMPLLIAQGTTDTLILPGPQADYVQQLCKSGVDVDYRTYDGKDHVGLVASDSPLIADLLEWTHRRLAGDNSTTTC